ncbi:hypothetical protein KUH03_35755 [Sphingobacterium sp. E70]|uniref:hypothetical protein n=1 Tax=Sphingobacterium sp. E70 TaxID=2853439 RepID=UPI00211C1C26|nr:hypothetical protein [Sphingobacterium sp. E70]ULT24323.1 hypothetical protein KUH03_35755 [Sphingobacterium sp. E70]
MKNNSYQTAQQWGDSPYDRSPYPTKLPAAAMTFDLAKFGKVVSNVLDIQTAVHTLKFDDGKILTSFVHATSPMGYFEITAKNIGDLSPELIPHQYENNINADEQKVLSMVKV